ncbi:MAG TPA: type IV secretion system protein VirB10 [Steroidobacteraceae bacterium]|nr:type IV secretion system protein VirB10 [Steroidobacteraceae bacterium]
MVALGAAALGWYYSNTLSHRSPPRHGAASDSLNRTQADVPLPPLGPMELTGAGHPVAVNRSATDRPSEESTGAGDTALASAFPTVEGVAVPAVAEPAISGPAATLEREPDRRLAGAAFARQSVAPEGIRGAVQPPEGADSGPNVFGGAVGPAASPAVDPTSFAAADRRAGGQWASLLRPEVLTAVRASVLPQRRFLLAKGTFIDCTLETAIDSTLPGMTTCVTPTDTFGADGDVVLLERGTKLIGETRGQVQQGAARIFVLWSEARTPTGVAVKLDSPATDELGRAGLGGEVARHFWSRFGAALLVSTVDGAVQVASQSASRGSGAIIYNPTATEGVATEALKGTVDIPPTLRKRNGERVQVFVARDLDFGPVYSLRALPGDVR